MILVVQVIRKLHLLIFIVFRLISLEFVPLLPLIAVLLQFPLDVGLVLGPLRALGAGLGIVRIKGVHLQALTVLRVDSHTSFVVELYELLELIHFSGGVEKTRYLFEDLLIFLFISFLFKFFFGKIVFLVEGF